MLQIQKMYQDVKNIVKRLPKDTRINWAIQQISMHLHVSALIPGTVRFQSGVRDTSPVSQLPFPVNTGVLKEPVVRKRKSATTTTDTQGTSSQPSSQPATTGPTAAKVAKVSLSSPIGSDWTDIELMVNQCHRGEAYSDDVALKRHIKVVHKNDYWACSGDWMWDDGTESRFHKCAKTNLLSGSISKRNIKIATCITVLLKIVSGAWMRYQCSPNTLERFIKGNLLQM